jgi:hypothetical protein
MRWDGDLGRHVLEWNDGGPDPIWRVGGPSRDPEPIVAHPEALLTLVDVVMIDGHPNVLYRRYMGGPGGRPGDEAWDRVVEYLCLYDLVDGTSRELGRIGSYESSYNTVRIGGDLAAVTHTPYGESAGTQVGTMPLADLDDPVEHDWLPRLFRLTHGPAVRCPDSTCSGWAHATIDPGGVRMSWIEGGQEWLGEGESEQWPIAVVNLDVATQEETMRVELGSPTAPDDGPVRPRYIDDDGSHVVISGVGPAGRAVMVDSRGEVVDLGLSGATVTFWDAGSPSGVVSAVVLRGDGIGTVDFGTPTAEAMIDLEEMLGPPDRQSEGFFSYRHWDRLSLIVAFDEYPFYRNDGVEHLVSWGVWDGAPQLLRTTQGITVDSSYADVADEYADRVTVPERIDECVGDWYVHIDDPGPNNLRQILIWLNGPAEPASQVTGMHAGAGDGC